jgi:sugar phosphate isomerase/epimerase
MKQIPIAVQLYSIREPCAKDLPGTLAQVARMGYQGVEFAGYHGFNAKDIRRMLDNNRLRCAGTHTGLPTLLGGEFQKTVEFNQTIGNRFLIVPALPEEYRKTLDGWAKAADVLNEIAERAAAVGMRVGYHNHAVEFLAVNGQYPWDVLFSRARRDVVMQLDSGNARHAGVDIVPFIERYPGRAATVHLKEWTDNPKGAVIGEGKVPWETIFLLCESVGGTEWYIVEQETYPYPPMEAVERCLKNLRRMKK